MAQAAETASAADALQWRYGRTQRLDRWWLEPALVAVGLLSFVAYTSVSALLGEDWTFEVGPYLSPLFEPLFRVEAMPDWFSPAFWVLWVPLSFRTTCYYYRRAYYRSFFLSPPACAVNEPAKSYSGERDFPFVLQNVHRFTMYAAMVFVPILWIGAIRAFYHDGELGIGVGSLVLTLNAFLLMMYTIGCHSWRHLVAGGLNQFSHKRVRRVRYHLWVLFTKANEHHRLWAWTSLIFVGLTDLYIHLVANDTITDLNTWSSF